MQGKKGPELIIKLNLLAVYLKFRINIYKMNIMFTDSWGTVNCIQIIGKYFQNLENGENLIFAEIIIKTSSNVYAIPLYLCRLK